LLQSNPSLITSDLANLLDNFIQDQINLINGSNTELNPEILKLLDLGLFLSK